jgi:hypothetical protein
MHDLERSVELAGEDRCIYSENDEERSAEARSGYFFRDKGECIYGPRHAPSSCRADFATFAEDQRVYRFESPLRAIRRGHPQAATYSCRSVTTRGVGSSCPVVESWTVATTPD